MPCPSATLAVWSSAWLHGASAADDVLDALQVWCEEHEFVAGDTETAERADVPLEGTGPGLPAAGFLALLRTLGASEARLALPVAGDVRGLGGHRELTRAALRAGEAAVFGDVASGALAAVGEHVAEGLIRWRVYDITMPPPPEHIGIGDAERVLTEAIRDSTASLQELDLSSERRGVRDELSGKLRARGHSNWPRNMPQRALRLMQRAEEVNAIVELALADEPGAAHSASAAGHRGAALRPLSEAVRMARCAAVEESVRVLSGV